MGAMVLSRPEINLRRLLAKCELMCKNNQKNDDRFPKYIESLESMLQEVKKLSDPISDSVATYQRRITAIKSELGLISNDVTEIEAEKMRNDLLGTRKRNVSKIGSGEDLDHVLKFHENQQQKITADMLILTKSLKEQSELANKIIKRDTEVVSKSAELTEQNYSKLNVESQKLKEHSKRACKCWMWVMLIIVMVVFINMVLFMKVMKKK